MSSQAYKIVQNSEKQLPCNIEAEQALIGSVLVSNDIYDEISNIVDSQKFFDPIHVKIYTTIETLISKGPGVTTGKKKENECRKSKIHTQIPFDPECSEKSFKRFRFF